MKLRDFQVVSWTNGFSESFLLDEPAGTCAKGDGMSRDVDTISGPEKIGWLNFQSRTWNVDEEKRLSVLAGTMHASWTMLRML